MQAQRSYLLRILQSAVTPVPELTVTEWANAHRILSSESSAEPGKYSSSRTPYIKEIMDCCTDPTIDTVTWMSASQVAKTELLLNIIGYYISHDPCPILCLQPTTRPMAEDFSRDRLAPMIRDAPILNARVFENKKSSNTLLHKSFLGGHVTLGGANSPSGLASRPIRITLCDEIDRYPVSAGTEGDPLMLVEKRTITFWNKKKFRTSTPSIEGQSRISDCFADGDMRHYYVPCPHCDEYQMLIWSGIKWKKNKKNKPDFESIYYECEYCKAPIEHVEKRSMLEKGEWRGLKPCAGHASFHLSALYSPWMTWKEVVEEWHNSRHDTEKMKVWTNTVLGETFKPPAREIPHTPLLENRINYKVPNEILVVVCSVDVQEDRLELLVSGWGEGEHSWHLHHKIIPGDTTLGPVWDDLETYINTTRIKRDDGAVMRIAAVGIDSGYQTKVVYDFYRRSRHPRVFCLKGVGGERAIVSAPVKSSRSHTQLYTVGSDPAKDVIFGRLLTPMMAFNFDCNEEYFLQLTAEKAETKMKRGFEFREWVKIRPRNEILDLWQYALAVLYILDPVWTALLPKETEKKTEQQQQPPPRRRRGQGFVQSWRR